LGKPRQQGSAMANGDGFRAVIDVDAMILSLREGHRYFLKQRMQNHTQLHSR
jgi:hypothetical protein